MKKDEYKFYEEVDFPASADDLAHTSLADLCHCIHAPLYAYDQILQWSQHAYLSGYCFPTDAPSYHHLISSLRKHLNLSHLSHGTAMIQKCGGGTLQLPFFDVESMFYDLIDDPRIASHLLINYDCPNKPPNFTSPQFLDKVHTGKWHQKSSKPLLKEHCDVLCGIILFSDGTHVTSMSKDKLSMNPLMFTLSIIPHWLHNQPFAWSPLGYLPKLPPTRKLGQNMDTFHHCLNMLLSGVVKAQCDGGLTWKLLTNDGREILLCFKVPLCYMIGDVEGHDLCTHYGNHANTKCLCWECDCLTDDADDWMLFATSSRLVSNANLFLPPSSSRIQSWWIATTLPSCHWMSQILHWPQQQHKQHCKWPVGNLHLPFHPNDPPSDQIQWAWCQSIAEPEYKMALWDMRNPRTRGKCNIRWLIIAYHHPMNLGNLLSHQNLTDLPGPPVSSFHNLD